MAAGKVIRGAAERMLKAYRGWIGRRRKGWGEEENTRESGPRYLIGLGPLLATAFHRPRAAIPEVWSRSVINHHVPWRCTKAPTISEILPITCLPC